MEVCKNRFIYKKIVSVIQFQYKKVKYKIDMPSYVPGYDETLSVKVLSLNLYAFLASTHTEPAKRLPYFNSDQHPSLFPDSEDFDPASAISNPSPYRNPRMPLTEDFEYPSASEMTTIGVFNGEEAVEFLKQSWNFVHNSELCCVYHYKVSNLIPFANTLKI